MRAVDSLASEYKWTQVYIETEVYFDDFLALVEIIAERKKFEYLMQLNIVMNPHREKPEELWNLLSGASEYYQEETLDKDSFEALKRQLSRGSSIKVK